jgi:hypothetical protein
MKTCVTQRLPPYPYIGVLLAVGSGLVRTYDGDETQLPERNPTDSRFKFVNWV